MRNDLAEAQANVANIADPELKRIAFESELARIAEQRKRLDRWVGYAGGLAGLAAVILGIFISIEGYNDAKVKDAVARGQEAEARLKEAEARKVEAHKPSIELRKNRYLEILKVVGEIAAQDQDPEKLKAAKRRFWELYWAELSLVEDSQIEGTMVELGKLIDPSMQKTPLQDKTHSFALLIRSKITTLEAVR